MRNLRAQGDSLHGIGGLAYVAPYDDDEEEKPAAAAGTGTEKDESQPWATTCDDSGRWPARGSWQSDDAETSTAWRQSSGETRGADSSTEWASWGERSWWWACRTAEEGAQAIEQEPEVVDDGEVKIEGADAGGPAGTAAQPKTPEATPAEEVGGATVTNILSETAPPLGVVGGCGSEVAGLDASSGELEDFSDGDSGAPSKRPRVS